MGNFLNLVFDDWLNEETPKPNCNNVNDKFQRTCSILPEVMLNNNNLYNIKKHTLDYVNENEYFYYVISHVCALSFFYDENDWAIPLNVEEKIRNNGLRVIFLSEHESFMDVEEQLNTLKNLIIKKNLNQEQFYIINNNSRLEEYKVKLDLNINIFKCNYLLELTSLICRRINSTEINYDKKFLFLCQNRRPKTHRIALLTLLKNNGHLDTPDLIDWSLPYGHQEHPDLVTFKRENFIEGLTGENMLEDYEFICKNKKLSYFEQEKDWFETPEKYECNHVEITTHKNSYINIITESHFEINETHLTEKTYKPFAYYQIPLFLASYKHVDDVRKRHDLFLFDDLINHDYDNEINNKQRLIKVYQEIDRLSKIKNEVIQYYKDNHKKLKHNSDYIKYYGLSQNMDFYFSKLIGNSFRNKFI